MCWERDSSKMGEWTKAPSTGAFAFEAGIAHGIKDKAKYPPYPHETRTRYARAGGGSLGMGV